MEFDCFATSSSILEAIKDQPKPVAEGLITLDTKTSFITNLLKNINKNWSEESNINLD
jgi:hypothetical protein